jgi:hypothetical protein
MPAMNHSRPTPSMQKKNLLMDGLIHWSILSGPAFENEVKFRQVELVDVTQKRQPSRTEQIVHRALWHGSTRPTQKPDTSTKMARSLSTTGHEARHCSPPSRCPESTLKRQRRFRQTSCLPRVRPLRAARPGGQRPSKARNPNGARTTTTSNPFADSACGPSP